jgi:hypothetical protein
VLSSAMKEVQVGGHLLLLECHTPPVVLHRQRVACTPEDMVSLSKGWQQREWSRVFGCSPMEFADELEKEASVASVGAVSSASESRFRAEKQTSKVADNGYTLSKRDSAITEIYNASTAPPPSDKQSLRNPRVLVWIRRDLFIARRFCAADCFPAREGERLPFPKPFKFSRDWWSWRDGGREICKQILMMAPGGRGGYKKQGGRGGQAVGGNKPPQKPQLPQGS